MSAIVSDVINSTVGLLCSKLREYTAERLNEGDLNDEKCRQIIVEELDDIKSKLDGLSRKDLLASLSFFKEGVTRLYTSLETSSESCDGPSTSQTSVENESQVEGATAMIPFVQAERDAIQRASELSNLIGNLKIGSQERYRSAKKSFEEAKRLATEAFNNVALSSEDRLMASKLRIASRILECLDDPEAAVRDCLLYLKELHDLPAVQAMFSVWYDSEEGFTSRLRAFFNQTKRNVNVESIQMINALLLDLAIKFTNINAMGCLKWPMIKIGKAIIYHPVLYNNTRVRAIAKNMQCPFAWSVGDIRKNRSALTSKGEILSGNFYGKASDLTIATRNGGCKSFFTIPSENDADIRTYEIRCLDVDENDNVYIVTEICPENVPTKYKLFTLDANGNVKADRLLDIIEDSLVRPQMSVTKDGMIVIHCDEEHTMYICDSKNAMQDYKFTLPINELPKYNFDFGFAVSNENDICTFHIDEDRNKFYMYIITMNGELKRAVQIPATVSGGSEMGVVFNHVNETIIVSLCNDGKFSSVSDADVSYDGDSDDDDSGDDDSGDDDSDDDDSGDDDSGDDDSDDDDSGDDDSGDDDSDAYHFRQLNRSNLYFRKLPYTTIYSFSNTGELLHQFNVLGGKCPCLMSHPKGPIALIQDFHSQSALMLQM